MPYEFRDFLTDEKSKYYFDYSMRDILRDQDGYPTEMTLLACAMLKETAERYRAMMRRAGFKLQVLTPSECAYAGVLAAYYRRTGLPQRDMRIVNLGYTAAYLYIYRGAFFESRREIDLGTAAWISMWPTAMCCKTTTTCSPPTMPNRFTPASPWR